MFLSLYNYLISIVNITNTYIPWRFPSKHKEMETYQLLLVSGKMCKCIKMERYYRTKHSSVDWGAFLTFYERLVHKRCLWLDNCAFVLRLVSQVKSCSSSGTSAVNNNLVVRDDLIICCCFFIDWLFILFKQMFPLWTVHVCMYIRMCIGIYEYRFIILLIHFWLKILCDWWWDVCSVYSMNKNPINILVFFVFFKKWVWISTQWAFKIFKMWLF